MIDRLGQVQIDSVNVLARAHYLPAFSRLGAYDTAAFDRLAAGPKRRVFEYWGHEAALIDVELQPALRWRMPAHDLEHVVATALANWLDHADSHAANLQPDLDASDYVAIARSARRLAASVRDGEPEARHDAIRALVTRVDVGDDTVTIAMRWAPIVDAEHPLADATATIVTPASRVRRGDDIRLVIGGADPTANRDPRLVDLSVEARLAYQHLLTSTAPSLDEVAAEHGHSRKHFSRLLRLATLAPDIVAAILDGRQPAHMSRTALLVTADVPVAWGEQRAALGCAAG